MKKTPQLISALMTLALGILFVILKAEVIGIAITVLGVLLIVVGVLDIVRKALVSGVIKAVLGVAILIMGWLLLDIAITILGIVLLVYGVLELIRRLTAKKRGMKLWAKVLALVEPVLCIVASVVLITSGGSALGWAVLIAGVVFIIEGVLGIIAALGAK